LVVVVAIAYSNQFEVLKSFTIRRFLLKQSPYLKSLKLLYKRSVATREIWL